MRTIQRTISLEPMTSRLPGMLPAYKDNVLYFFDEDSLKKRGYEFPSNYGMVPVNIMVEYDESGNTWNLVYDSHCYGTTINTDDNCYDDEHYEKYDIFKHLTLSWYTLSEWYKFFTDYYHLLNDWGHCGTAYSSATHYYSAESKNGYAPQLIYGADEQTYIDMDELFKERGGIVSLTTCSATSTTVIDGAVEYKCNFDKCSDHTIISEAIDNGFYKWICENIIPSFTIPVKYKDYWKCDKLFYPDVIKWSGWLEDRSSYAELGSILNCSGETDCCECEKWFNLGGNDILSSMTEWYETVGLAIKTNNETISGAVNCAIPTVIEPINLQISIDNLGELSIFSTEYELGTDYRTIPTEGKAESTLIHYESGNTHSGTVVTMDGSVMILSGGSGFIYDEKYLEKYISKCNNQYCGYEGYFTHKCPKCGGTNISIMGWGAYAPSCTTVACSFEEYDDAYMEKNSGYTTDGTRTAYPQGNLYYYSFNDNDVRIVANNENDLRDKLAIKYPIYKRDAILIGSSLYDVQKEEYGIYDGSNKYISGNTFFVYREDYTDTPYTTINGKKIYADFYPFSGACSQFYYFPFFKEKTIDNDSTCSASTFNPDIYKKFPRTRTDITDYKEFITYNGSQHEVNSSGVTINGNDYIRINSGTCETPDGYFYITSDDKIYQLDDWNIEENSAYSAISETFEIKKIVDNDIQVYVGGIVTGNTISKLYDLRSNSLLVDDIGNTIEALYNVGERYNHQPPEGEKLEPIYQVGNVANVKRFNLTVENQEDLTGNTNYFVGDIITSMVFYYKDTEGHIVEETIVSADTPDSGQTTSLSAISASTHAKTTHTEGNEPADIFIFDDDIYCDITYYIGATLQRSGETKPFELAVDIGNMTFNHGIRYTETVKFVEKDVQYYLKNIVSKQIPRTKYAISAHTISYPVTCYVMEQEQNRIESDFNNFYNCALAHFEMPMCTSTTDFQLYNGTQTLPVFREEYKMGTACIQNVDSDIYINRGINAAFERHIKLEEVTSMESLEQYTNGYFKIIEN